MKTIKLYMYIIVLSILPLYVGKKILESYLDTAIIKSNKYIFTAPELSKVKTIYVYKGQHVNSGQKLMLLNSEELASKIKLTNDAIKNSHNEFANALSSLRQQQYSAEKDVSFQESQLATYKKYRESGDVSLIMMNNIYQNYQATKDRLNLINDNIIKLKQQYSQYFSDLAIQQAILQAQKNSLVLVTKESGVINSIYVQENQFVNAGNNLISIDNKKYIIVETNNILNNVTVKVGWSFVHCSATNISNSDKTISIIGVNKEKSIYVLDCKNMPSKYLIDNQFYYLWN